MSWNYRIVKYADGTGYGLHEVHYDKAGQPIRMTEQPAAFVGDSPDEIRSSLMMAKMDAMRRDVFDEPSDWKALDHQTIYRGLCQRSMQAPFNTSKQEDVARLLAIGRGLEKD